MKFKFKYKVEFDEDKNNLLKETRGMSFEDLLGIIKKGGVVGDIKHTNPKRHPNQRILVVRVGEYLYAIPYVIDDKKKINFLKTAYPSHRLTKKYEKDKTR